MSGLEKLKARILDEAGQQAQKILDDAALKAEELIKNSVSDAEKEAKELQDKAEQDSLSYKKRSESSAKMQKKQALLKARQEIIDDILDAAYKKIITSDDEEYLEILERLLEKHLLPRKGSICFSAASLKRMTDDFKNTIFDITEKRGASLTIVESDADELCDGGFILLYGGIEENCTIRAIFSSKRDELADIANRMLFT